MGCASRREYEPKKGETIGKDSLECRDAGNGRLYGILISFFPTLFFFPLSPGIAAHKLSSQGPVQKKIR